MSLADKDVIQFPRARERDQFKRNPRILLVNDHVDLRELLARMLQRAGYSNIIDAADGNDAVKHLRTTPVDLLITDVHMPYLDGWRLARMVRSGLFPSPNNLPIIAVSATFADRIAETTAKEFEINRFLSLPLQQRGELAATVRELLSAPLASAVKPDLLIIEDDPDTVILVMKMLRHRFDIEVVTDGRSGLHAWRERRHDLVLLDVMLPKMAGPEVLQAIMAEDSRQAVVIMTADGSAERCRELMLGGAVDFIPKPFHANQLRQICDMAVRRNDCLISNQQLSERTRHLKTVQSNYFEIADAHQRLLDNLSSVVFELDSEGGLRFLNPAWEVLSGHSVKSSIGQTLCQFLHPDDRLQYRSVIHSLTHGRKKHHEQEVRLISKRGETLWTEISLDSNVQRGGKRSEALFGHLVDITERKLAHQQLEHLAIHDSLTGLYNRRYFEISLEHMVAASARSVAPHALLYIDLDHFQMVNDTLSHREGDMVLKEVADLLRSRTRDADLLCRIGGDEFGMLLTHINDQQAVAVANSLIGVLNNYHYERDGHSITIGCSIGISIIDGSLASSSEHLVQADKASFVAKNRGRNLVHVYDPSDRDSDELRQSIDWAHRVRQAISEGRLELYIQPIQEVATGNVNHFEALLRLRPADSTNPITPGIFIPALEKAGQMHILDRWVIREAMELLSEHPQLAQLAVNLSGRAFADPELLPFIQEQLTTCGVDPNRVIFEITETAGVANINQTQRMIQQLRRIGCHFALDDFGTGFCSFHYLRHLPADYLKIDGSYIKNIADNELDRIMVRSMNEIAHQLGKKTIAECVESEAVLEYLKAIGVDYVQGHRIGQAAPIAK